MPGPSALLEGHTFGHSFSPNSSQLALGSDGTAELRFIDLKRMRVLGDLKLTDRGLVGATLWPRPDRMIAVVATPGCCAVGTTTVVVVDPVARRILQRRRLDRALVRVGRTRDRLVLLLAPTSVIGPAELALADVEGDLELVSLDRVLAGVARPPNFTEPYVVRQQVPGLAVDPDGGHAYVVSAGAEVVDVDLATGNVVYRTLAEPVSLFGRLRRFVEPEAAAKAVEGSERTAQPLGGGLVAVSGRNTQAVAAGNDEVGMAVQPAGLRLIDTRRWTVRTIERNAERFRYSEGVLVASGERSNSVARTADDIGIAAFDINGRERFQLFQGKRPFIRHVGDGRAYIGIPETSRVQVLDLATGRLLGRRKSFPEIVVEGQDWLYG